MTNYKQKLIDLLKSDDEVKSAIYDSFYKCDYNLQERFIRMYCENKNIRFSIHTNYYGGIEYMNFSQVYIEGNEYCKLNNTKDFDQQDDEVYQKIYEALNNLTK